MQPKLYIVEGPDAVGKTTAAKVLADLTGYEYRHMSKPPEDFDYWHDYFKGLIPYTVLDRFHLGGLIYGKRLGLHPTKITDEKWWAVNNRLRFQENAVVILMFCQDDEAYIQRLLKDEREQMFNMKQMVAVNAEFRRYAWDIASRKPKHEDLPFILWPVDWLGYPTKEAILKWR